MNEDYNYFQDSEFRQSLAAYEHMVATGEPADFDSETLTDIAEYYAISQRMDEADRCINYALSFYPDSVEPQIFLARQQMFFGNKDEAWRICNAIGDEDDREVKLLRAELHFYFNEANKAFEELQKGFEEAEEEEGADFLYDSIDLCKDYGFGDKAMEWVMLLRHEYPNYHDAISLQAEIHNYRREYTEAKALLEENLELIAYDWHAWMQMAEACLWTDCYEEALEAVDFVLAISPDNAEGLMMKANILQDYEQPAEAHEYYSRFLAFFPHDERAIYLDAQCFIDMQEYQMAVQRLERIANPQASNMRGIVLSFIAYCHDQMGHEEQALHYRQQAEKEANNCLPDLFPDLYPKKE